MKDYPKIVTGLLGFLIALISVSLNFSNLVAQPLPVRIAAVIGYVILGGGIIWFAFTTEASIKWRQASIGLLFAVTIPFFIWVGTWIATPVPVSSPPPVSLVSISYDIGDFDPRRVDLRTASTSGIPATVGQALRLFDLWFSATEDAPIYGVQAEIYANGHLLGSTPPKPLIAGLTKLDSVKIESYNHGSYPTSWNVQPDWKDLMVFLITYRDGKVVNRNLTIIHLTADGTAWFIDPPNLSFASIVYTVNDGPELVLDVRNAETVGFEAGPGDKLTLQEIWYDSNVSCRDCTVHVEISLLAPQERFDKNTYQETPPNVARRGIHKLNATPLSWTIPANKRFIDLTLFRSDRTVMDMLVLPLGLQGKHGLVPVK